MNPKRVQVHKMEQLVTFSLTYPSDALIAELYPDETSLKCSLSLEWLWGLGWLSFAFKGKEWAKCRASLSSLRSKESACDTYIELEWHAINNDWFVWATLQHTRLIPKAESKAKALSLCLSLTQMDHECSFCMVRKQNSTPSPFSLSLSLSLSLHPSIHLSLVKIHQAYILLPSYIRNFDTLQSARLTFSIEVTSSNSVDQPTRYTRREKERRYC